MSGGIDKEIKDSEKYELSGEDIMKIIQGNGKVMSYTELQKYETIDDLLNPHGAVVLLYESKKNYGHWVGLFKYGRKEIQFFDPYGFDVDEELNIGKPYYTRHNNDENIPHLTYLLKNSNYKVTHNYTRLQKFDSDVNTCGRHVACRLRFRETPLPEYIELLTKNKCYDPDWYVSILTILI